MHVKNQRSKSLGEESIISLLFKFSIPAIIGMLVNALYNIVDRIFIGRGVNELAIGGVFVGMPLSLILMAFAMLIGIGGNTLVSIKLGEGKHEDAEKILGNSLTLLFIVSIVISLLGLIFLDPLLKSFGASAGNISYARDYMKIILYGAPFQLLGFGLNNFIRGDGSPKVAMGTMLIGAILNTVLDPIFIFIFKMGVRGAALATIISQLVSAIWVLHYFIKGDSVLKIRKEFLPLKKDIILEIISLGFAPFSMQLAASMVTALLSNNLQKYGGELAVSSMSVVQSMVQLILMPVFGINQGSQPILGYNYGAKKYDRVKETLKYAVIGASMITFLGFIIVEFFPVEIFKLFMGNKANLDEILKIGVPGIRINLALLPIIGFQVVAANYFQATGKPKQSALLSLSRQILILIPLIVILPIFYGLNGVWLSGPISDGIATFITSIFLIKETKHLNKLNAEI